MLEKAEKESLQRLWEINFFNLCHGEGRRFLQNPARFAIVIIKPFIKQVENINQIKKKETVFLAYFLWKKNREKRTHNLGRKLERIGSKPEKKSSRIEHIIFLEFSLLRLRIQILKVKSGKKKNEVRKFRAWKCFHSPVS